MIAAALASLVAALQPGKMPLLQYYGGRVLSNVRVQPVRWGSRVAQSETDLNGFYGAMSQATALAWLDEYATNIPAVSGAAGTNQHIGGGSAAATITICPTTTANPISDGQIRDELVRQMANPPPGCPALPTPDLETVYMVHFPPGLTITTGGAFSCQSGGFCAFHSTYDKASVSLANHLLVGVIPDHSPGSGCDTGCGDSAIPFQNVTTSASHELIEVVTDPDISLLSANGPLDAPAAWWDDQPFDVESDHGEVADICADRPTGQPPLLRDAATLPGTSYVVQKAWSNAFKACIASTTDAFSVTAPATVKLANLNVPVDVAVQTTQTASATTPQVVVGVPNPPAGITVAQGATSAGQQATISVQAGQGVALPATMMIHADSAADPNTPNEPQATAFALVQLVADDFQMTPQLTQAQSKGIRIAAGTSADVTVAAITHPGDNDVDLSLSFQAPGGITASFAPPTARSSSAGTAIVATVAVDHGTPSGSVPGTVSATSGLVTRAATLLLVVDGDDFSLSLDKATDGVVRGGTVSIQVKTATTHGASQPLALSVQAPEGIGASFDQQAIQSGQTATLTLATGSAKSYGPQEVKIVAQGPHASQQASFFLGVGQSQDCSSAGGAPAIALLALLIRRRRR